MHEMLPRIRVACCQTQANSQKVQEERRRDVKHDVRRDEGRETTSATPMALLVRLVMGDKRDLSWADTQSTVGEEETGRDRDNQRISSQ